MSTHEQPEPIRVQRRHLLLGGSAGLASAALGGQAAASAGVALDPDRELAELLLEAESFAAGSCTLTPGAVEGPYWLNLALLRQDITEGTPGLPFTLYVKLVDASACTPISGAVVDLWHNDPYGDYSGFASEGTAGETWLRGIQITGAGGFVRFDTIYPGWYTGRTPHLHCKINPTTTSELTTQFYFDQSISTKVFRTAPYDVHGPNPVTNATDAFFDPDLLVHVGAPRGGPARLLAVMKIAIV